MIYLILTAIGFYFGRWFGALFLPGLFFYIMNKRGIKEFKSKYKAIKTGYPQRIFILMGYIAKKDGAVLPSHITFAKTVMQNFPNISEKVLQNNFNLGKNLTTLEFNRLILEINSYYSINKEIISSFIEISYLTMLSGNRYSKQNRDFLLRLSSNFGLGNKMVDFLESKYSSSINSYKAPTAEVLNESYKILNIDKSVDFKQLKMARKRLLNKYHPDKLVGSTDIEKDKASEMVIKINEAFSLIKESRGFK